MVLMLTDSTSADLTPMVSMPKALTQTDSTPMDLIQADLTNTG